MCTGYMKMQHPWEVLEPLPCRNQGARELIGLKIETVIR
jgi:hypothetical protein